MPFFDVGTRGFWNAATNVPIIKSGRGENGAAYQVIVAGSTEIDGINDWRVGDIILYMNDTWTRLPGQETLARYGQVRSSIQFVLDGGSLPIQSGVRGPLQIPYDCTIESWGVYADTSSSIEIDVWKSTVAAFPPTVADKITGTNIPKLVSATKNVSADVTSWTRDIQLGDMLMFNVAVGATSQRATLVLSVLRG